MYIPTSVLNTSTRYVSMMERSRTRGHMLWIVAGVLLLGTVCDGAPVRGSPLRNLTSLVKNIRNDVMGEFKSLMIKWEVDFIRRLDGFGTGQIPTQPKDAIGSSVCYPDLGCFSTGPPFFSQYRPINFLPARPDQIDTRFLLYTRGTRNSVHYLNPKDSNSIQNSPFSASRPTKIIVHGFLDNGQKIWLHDMKNEFLKAADYNVIIVGWGSGAGLPYTQATANTRVVGAEIARIIKLLQQYGRAHPEDMHVIGHSLGAHVAGYAGERTRGLGRITGLDPADPFYQYTDPVVRLDPTDALFVDVIHTDGESILKLGFGMKQSCGHVDYFPNSGENQPGCDQNIVDNIKIQGDIYNGGKAYIACSHLRSYRYFIETINSACPWQGYKCDSYANFERGQCMPCTGDDCGYMGYHADRVKPPRGTTHVAYYLDTGSAAPFCRYHYSIRVSFGNPRGAQTWPGKLTANVHGSKGVLGETVLTDEPLSIQPGKTFGFMVTSPRDLGQVNNVDIKWEHQSSLLNPLSWNLFNLRHPTLHVSKVNVIQGESRARFSLCGQTSDTTIETQHSMDFSHRCP